MLPLEGQAGLVPSSLAQGQAVRLCLVPSVTPPVLAAVDLLCLVRFGQITRPNRQRGELRPKQPCIRDTTEGKSGGSSGRESCRRKVLRPLREKSTTVAKRPGRAKSEGEPMLRPPRRCGSLAWAHCDGVRGVPKMSPRVWHKTESARWTRSATWVAEEHLVRKLRRQPSRRAYTGHGWPAPG